MSNETYYCPKCGGKMKHIGGLLDWECSKCGAEGSLEYDEVNKEDYIKLADEEYENLYDSPNEDNMPECCIACGGPYPDCMTSCKIFDD